MPDIHRDIFIKFGIKRGAPSGRSRRSGRDGMSFLCIREGIPEKKIDNPRICAKIQAISYRL
jgi:hypothetical protein